MTLPPLQNTLDVLPPASAPPSHLEDLFQALPSAGCDRSWQR